MHFPSKSVKLVLKCMNYPFEHDKFWMLCRSDCPVKGSIKFKINGGPARWKRARFIRVLTYQITICTKFLHSWVPLLLSYQIAIAWNSVKAIYIFDEIPRSSCRFATMDETWNSLLPHLKQSKEWILKWGNQCQIK